MRVQHHKQYVICTLYLKVSDSILRNFCYIYNLHTHTFGRYKIINVTANSAF